MRDFRARRRPSKLQTRPSAPPDLFDWQVGERVDGLPRKPGSAVLDRYGALYGRSTFKDGSK